MDTIIITFIFMVILFIANFYFTIPFNIKLFITFIFMVFLIFIASVRVGIGYDYYSYDNMFYLLPSYIEYSFKKLIELTSYITDGNFNIFIFFTSFLSLGLLFYGIIINCFNEAWLFASYFFVGSDLFFFYLNGIRQAIAISIVFISYYFIFVNKIRYFIILVLVASTFHFSALFVLLAYFIFRNLTKKLIFILYGISILLYFLQFDEIVKFIATINPNYELFIQVGGIESLKETLSSYNILKLVVPNLLFIYMLNNKYYEKYQKVFVLYFIYIFLYNSIGGKPFINRLVYYFEPSFLILISYIWKFDINKKILILFLGMYYLIFCLITIVFLKTHGCYPYVTIFS